MEQTAPKYHYSSEHFTKLYVTVAATEIKPDDPYKKVTKVCHPFLWITHTLGVQNLEASINRVGLVQEEFCL
jgi:hypothetical protein